MWLNFHHLEIKLIWIYCCLEYLLFSLSYIMNIEQEQEQWCKYWTIKHTMLYYSPTEERLKNKRPTWCHLLFYFTSYVLNMFQTLIYPSSEACNTDTTPTQPHRNSTIRRTKNNTTNVVIQQNSRKLLMMDILMSETCWAHKKWNKIASDIKLVFYSSTLTMMHGPINIRWRKIIY